MKKLLIAALAASVTLPALADDAIEVTPERRALLIEIIEGLGCKVNGAAPPKAFFICGGVLAVTSAPKPPLATLTNRRSFTLPTSIIVGVPLAARCKAAKGSPLRIPMLEAKSFAVP